MLVEVVTLLYFCILGVVVVVLYFDVNVVVVVVDTVAVIVV